jgi:D-serine deaminase-like pyridoxal phosphate-dependent protein
MKLRDIPTPALVIDVPAMERNIRRMADFAAESGCLLRPHFKAVKTPEIARRQLAAGGCVGLTCQTVGEVEVAIEEGLTTDILLTNEIIGPGKADRVARVAGRGDVKVAVDSEFGVRDLARAAREAGTEIGVVVDVNVGLVRCGVEPGEPAVALARLVHETPGLRLSGVMGYEGHAVGKEDRAEREALATKAMGILLPAAQQVREAGLPVGFVSAGGTGTYDITGRMEGINEIQPGSYVLMDTAYAKLDLPFEQAFSILGTVIHRSPGHCVLDTGLKACAVDHGNPSIKAEEGASVRFLSDEHATIDLPASSKVAVGDPFELWPSHIDPNINLHDVMYAVDNGEVVGIWPISARGYREQREIRL